MNPCLTLLITDDDPAMRESLCDVFARGVRTIEASDGKEACELVYDHEVHIVLMDYNMPKMTGLEALQTIKSFRRELPVILMSAELDDQLTARFRDAHAYAVHSKPLNIRRIRNDIAAAVQSVYDQTIDWKATLT